MDSQKALKYPPDRRALSRISFPVRKRQVSGLKTISDAPSERRVDQQARSHHHEQGHDQLLALQVDRGSLKH